MKRIKTFIPMAVSLLTMATSAPVFAIIAAPLPPGSFLTPVPGRAAVSGASVFATVTTPFVGSISGSLVTTVYKNDLGNPFLGGLTFQYDVTSPADLGRMTVDSWGVASGPLSAAVNQLAVNAEPALSADRTTGTGDTIGFNLEKLLTAGTSTTVFLYSPLTSVTGSGSFFINGGTATAGTLAPIPEPTTMIAGALLLLPFAASTLRVLRRNRVAAA